MSVSDRLGCSTISFRHLTLPAALDVIAGLGFTEVDLGALPGVCDHVPFDLDAAAVAGVARDVAAAGLRVRSVNGDIGDLNAVLDATGDRLRSAHLDRLLELTEAVNATALVLPNGALSHQPATDLTDDLNRAAEQLNTAATRAAVAGVQLWVETLHVLRLCHDLDRARQLTERLDPDLVGVVMDTSHVVAAGTDPADFTARFAERIRHVHLRDATPSDIHRSIGNGEVDFPAVITDLDNHGYDGHFALELETRDITDDQRPAATARAAALISALL